MARDTAATPCAIHDSLGISYWRDTRGNRTRQPVCFRLIARKQRVLRHMSSMSRATDRQGSFGFASTAFPAPMADPAVLRLQVGCGRTFGDLCARLRCYPLNHAPPKSPR